ncbi:cell division ATP-binding protein FtsE [candidate division WWE3 bacterium CG10_big_fil_rev_8_21_14_0_10_32_10]|uniref:Cell division ATP-binding protein FtsE n=1 Tax=candidate division WWE3 bacterium CG10_big_fil_rev_8_21_14_0_10_32_10 TaxID=1975090 RepID=A0A2H0R9L1_UNCKA|nr:MAG: cell division ATP-binding protein FtsE [candidate division WWE3 bacterium CG10_big_fil_rev_8_21_14_0_10_32_10]
MLAFENITKKYGKDVVLDSVDMVLGPGEFAFLTGPSGAGKSTLLRLILKEESVDSGKIFIDSEDITKVSKKDMPKVRRKVGFVFQDYRLLPSKNSFENVSIALEIKGKSESVIKKIIPDLLASVGLANKMDNYPWQLSGGEKQRLAIARALALEPKIIVADEPTGNLDNATSWEIINLLSDINKKEGTTILVATHNLDVVNTLKNRVFHLENGRIIKNV